jgi:glycosyltransferase involved in cell wall biosynthesis
VRDFVDAAGIIKSRGVQARFLVAGNVDPDNPASVDAAEVERWSTGDLVEYVGHRTDIPRLFGSAHIVVLPSYREGMPKVLLEAAACGRAVVTTDVPGCRDAIDAGKTGLLVPAKEPYALANAIQSLVEDAELRNRMGIEGRRLAERCFDINSVVDEHLRIYGRTLARSVGRAHQ